MPETPDSEGSVCFSMKNLEQGRRGGTTVGLEKGATHFLNGQQTYLFLTSREVTSASMEWPCGKLVNVQKIALQAINAFVFYDSLCPLH